MEGNGNNELGLIYSDQKQYEKALECFNMALKAVNNRSPTAFSNIGDTYFDMKKYDLALENYKKSLELYPDAVQTYIEISNTYIELGDLRGAYMIIQKGLEKFKENPELTNELAKIYFYGEKYDDAEKLWKFSLSKAPDDFMTLVNYIKFLKDIRKDYWSAFKYAEHLAKSNKNDASLKFYNTINKEIKEKDPATYARMEEQWKTIREQKAAQK